jgi:hypothetical protein
MKIFNQTDYEDFEKNLFKEIEKKIFNEEESVLLEGNEDEYLEKIYTTNALQPLELKIDHILSKGPKVDYINNMGVYLFRMKIPFIGSEELLGLRPRGYAPLDLEGEVANNFIDTSIIAMNPDRTEFDTKKRKVLRDLAANVRRINKNVEKLNRVLPAFIKNTYSERVAYLQKLSDSPIPSGVKINEDTNHFFYFRPIKIKPIMKSSSGKKGDKTPEPVLHEFIFMDIKKTIFGFLKVLEKKPSTYLNRNEEDFRNILFSMLEYRYESTSSTGETFYPEGNSSISIRSDDDTSIFVVDCRLWNGKKRYLDSLEQLLKGLLWNESKAILIEFVDRKDFSSVLETVKNETKHLSYCMEQTNISNETSISYLFKLPENRNKRAMVEVMLFHIPSEI